MKSVGFALKAMREGFRLTPMGEGAGGASVHGYEPTGALARHLIDPSPDGRGRLDGVDIAGHHRPGLRATPNRNAIIVDAIERTDGEV